MTMDDPNFPPRLEINPSENSFGDSEIFGVDSQKSAIQKYGIAGRVWEAAYTLAAYLESRDPQIEFDPPTPFSGRRPHHQFQSLPASPPGRAGPNLNRNENGYSNPSGPSSDLDAVDPPALTVLELGSGTGIIIAKLANIINQDGGPGLHADDILVATDLENVCPLLDQNLPPVASESRRANHPSPRILVHPLEWGNLDHTLKISNELGPRGLTHIICSDLVYFPHLLAPLLRSLIHLTSPPFSPQQTIIISYRIRSLQKESPFWSAFGLWFSYEPVLYRQHRNSPTAPRQGSYESDRPSGNICSNEDSQTDWARYHLPSSTYIFIAHRKSISLHWSVPKDDGDLLGGVGAQGDQRRKGDDVFDLMLLMSMDGNED